MSDNKFSFIGGDIRQYYMLEQLHAMGSQLSVYGLKLIKPIDGITQAASLEEAMAFCENIVCPVPFTKDNITINSNSFMDDMTIENFISGLKYGHKIFGGNISSIVKKSCLVKDIPYYDFMEIEEVSILNAVATAEGAIAEAIKSSPSNMHKSKCLVLGYGRCARILAHKLKGIDTFVTVSSRNADQLATAEAYGYNALPLQDLAEKISEFLYIFNTIPALILDESVINGMRKDVTIIDIASNPGGTDFNKCKELGINAYLCLGLPGKYSPQTSAEILNSVLLQYR